MIKTTILTITAIFITVFAFSQITGKDLTIGTPDFASMNLNESGDQIHLSNNRFISFSQISSAHFQTFGANVQNQGTVNIIPTDNAWLKMDVQREVGGVWSSVFKDSTLIDSTFSQNLRTITGTITDLSWVKIGNYKVVYEASLATDEDNSNNSIEHFFTVTPNDYVSKVGLDNGKPLATSFPFPSGAISSYELGTIFNFPTAGSDSLTIDTLRFVYQVPTAFAGLDNQTIFANIYEYNNTVFPILNTTSSLTQIGIAPVSLSGLTAKAGTVQEGKAFSFIDAATGGPMPALQNNKQYYVSIMINPSLLGGPATFTANDVINLGVSDNKNYNLNADIINPVPQVTPFRTTDAVGIETWSWNGDGLGMAFSMGLDISTRLKCFPTDSTFSVTECVSYLLPSAKNTITTVVGTQTIMDTITNSCGADSVLTITVTILPKKVSSVTQSICFGDTLWVGTIPFTRDTVAEVIISNVGPNNCDSTVMVNLTLQSTSDCTTGINENNLANNSINVYPNPTQGQVTIELLNSSKANVEVRNTLGQVILTQQITNNQNIINLQNIESGLYFVKVGTIDKEFIERLIVE